MKTAFYASHLYRAREACDSGWLVTEDGVITSTSREEPSLCELVRFDGCALFPAFVSVYPSRADADRLIASGVGAVVLKEEANGERERLLQRGLRCFLASDLKPFDFFMDRSPTLEQLTKDGALPCLNGGNPLKEMSALALYYKGMEGDAAALPAESVLRFATENAPKALNIRCGALKAGYFADFIAVDFNNSHTLPVYNPVSQLIYSTENSDIKALYVGGKKL